MEATQSRPRILVLDDDPVAARLASGVARLAGYEVRVFQDAGEAARAARTWPPDLVISDVWMPGIDGTELCVMLKADPATRRVPILLVSAQEDFDQEGVGRFCGSTEFQAKPLSPLRLLRTINRLLGRAPADFPA